MKRHPNWLSQLAISNEHKRAINSLLSFLGLEDDQLPAGLLGVCENFERCCNICPIELPAELSKHLKTATMLLNPAFRAHTLALPELQPNRQRPAGKLLWGLLSGDSAPYSALYVIHPSNPDALLRFQTWMLIALVELRRGGTALKPNHITSFCTGIRSLCEPVYSEWFKSKNPLLLTSPEDLLELLTEHDRAGVTLLHDRCHLLLDIIAGRKVTLRDGGSRSRFNSHGSWKPFGISALGWGNYIEPETYGDEDDLSEHPGIYSLRQTGELDEEQELLGLEPAELTSRTEFLFHTAQELSPIAQAFNSRLKTLGAIKQIERSNQFLPMATDRLNEHDIHRLIELVRNLQQNQNDQVALALMAMLLTGSSFDRVTSLVIFPAESPVVFDSGQALGFSLQHHAWVLAAYTPPFETRAKAELKGSCRASDSPYLLLPEPKPSLTTNLITRLAQQGSFRPFKNQHNLRISSPHGQLPNLEGDLTSLLKKLLKSTAPRLTLTRIERCLPKYVAERSESTVATYLFNSYMPTSSARSFYTTITPEVLRSRYIEARQWLSDLHGGTHSAPTFELQDNLYNEPFGGRYCPTRPHVINAAEGLLSQHKALGSSLLTAHGAWIDFHNHFTATVIYLQGFFSAIRAVRDPFVSVDQIIERYAIATFQDKDSTDQSHTRTIPVHPLLLKLAQTYRAHRCAVLARLSMIRLPDARTLMAPGAPETFLLDKSGNVIETRPSTLLELLRPHTPLPLNSNRKFLRTELLEIGTPPCAIDLLMGHASRGEPVGHQFSAASFSEYSKMVTRDLELLLSDVGITKAASSVEGLPL